MTKTLSLVSGDSNDGTYEASFTIPQGSTAGTWKLGFGDSGNDPAFTDIYGTQTLFSEKTFTVTLAFLLPIDVKFFVSDV